MQSNKNYWIINSDFYWFFCCYICIQVLNYPQCTATFNYLQFRSDNNEQYFKIQFGRRSIKLRTDETTMTMLTES